MGSGARSLALYPAEVSAIPKRCTRRSSLVYEDTHEDRRASSSTWVEKGLKSMSERWGWTPFRESPHPSKVENGVPLMSMQYLPNTEYKKNAKILLHRRGVGCSIPCLTVVLHFFGIFGIWKILHCPHVRFSKLSGPLAQLVQGFCNYMKSGDPRRGVQLRSSDTPG